MKKYVLGIFLMSLSVTIARADEINLSSDLWCPYACDPASDKPGFMIEIAKEVFTPLGHTVNYKLINWARAISDTREGKFTALVGASKTDAPDFIFPKNQIGQSQNYFWINKFDSWVYKDVKSLKNKKIGIINSYSYGDEIDQEVQNKNPGYVVVSGDDALMKMIRMTKAKRLGGFVENPNVLNYQLMNIPEFSNQFVKASANITKDTQLFIAFSPANINAKKYSEILSDGVETLRKNGKLKIILMKYGLKDWK